MTTDHVIYELNVIRNAYKRLTPNERNCGYIGNLIQRYTIAVEHLPDPVLARVYELMFVVGHGNHKVAAIMHFDVRTIYRKYLRLVSSLTDFFNCHVI